MNDIYSGIHKEGLESVFDKAKEKLFYAGEAVKHCAHNAYDLIAGDDNGEIDLEANCGFRRRGYHAINMEPHHDFLQYDE